MRYTLGCIQTIPDTFGANGGLSSLSNNPANPLEPEKAALLGAGGIRRDKLSYASQFWTGLDLSNNSFTQVVPAAFTSR